jgi:hypothetical protein
MLNCDLGDILKNWNKTNFRHKKFINYNRYYTNIGVFDILRGNFYEDYCGIRFEVCIEHTICIESHRSLLSLLEMTLQLYGFNLRKEISFSRSDYKRSLMFCQRYKDSDYER